MRERGEEEGDVGLREVWRGEGRRERGGKLLVGKQRERRKGVTEDHPQQQTHAAVRRLGFAVEGFAVCGLEFAVRGLGFGMGLQVEGCGWRDSSLGFGT